MSEYLLEIGMENLPAAYVSPAVEQLRADIVALLAASRIEHGDVYATGTPRRLVLRVEGMAASQSAGVDLVTGPPVARAFEADGTASKAAEGFARGQGVAVSSLEKIVTDRGEYVGVRKKLSRRRSGAVLAEALPGIVAGLKFPKSMKWEPSGARFARPVRWIVSLLGSSVVRFRFADVTAANRTYGRPWFREEVVTLRSASAWPVAMKKLGVVADMDERRKRIDTLSRAAATRAKLRCVPDEALIDELAQMSENPLPLVGTFDRKYLDLPPEVVTTAMRSHQRYIALATSRGRLAPKFITFTDGPVTGAADVRRGNERVLRARLEDASFYYREDVARGVDALADELDRIVFVESLGSIGDKVRRVERVALVVNKQFSVMASADEAQLSRASRIAKSDLASEMIKDGKEFTRLQGIIGAYYALACGEGSEIAAAIRDHYLPRGPKDPLPTSAIATALSLADRIDTICGCFIAGFKPSGSQDPYALRRAANGMIRLIENEHGIELNKMVETALAGYDAAATKDVRAEIIDFMRQRVESYLKESGIEFDVAEAVLASTWTRPGLARSRAVAIQALRGDDVFERLITGVKRVGNILPAQRRAGDTWESIVGRLGVDGGAGAVDAGRFEFPAEEALLRATREAIHGVSRAEAAGRFPDVLRCLSRLADPIDGFFDTVLVNAEDSAVRANRHAFLATIYAIFARYADFSRIVERPMAP